MRSKRRLARARIRRRCRGSRPRRPARSTSFTAGPGAAPRTTRRSRRTSRPSVARPGAQARPLVQEPAAGGVVGRRPGAPAAPRRSARSDAGSARRSGSPRGRSTGRRDLAADRHQLRLHRSHRRRRAQQRLGVRVARPGEHVCDRAVLHDHASVDDVDPVAQLGDHAEVVGDEQDRGAVAVADLAQQIEHLGLDRDVERGGRLVGDQQLGAERQAHRDHRPLLHAARELVRVFARPLLGRAQMHAPEQVDRLGLRRLPRRPPVQDIEARPPACRCAAPG